MKKWIDRIVLVIVATLCVLPFAFLPSDKPSNLMEFLEKFFLLYVAWTLMFPVIIFLLGVFGNIIVDKLSKS